MPSAFMKRTLEVSLSTVVLELGSRFTLLMSAGKTLGGFVVALVLVGLAAWAIVKIIGLLRLHFWARYSTLVIGGFLAFMRVAALPGIAEASGIHAGDTGSPSCFLVRCGSCWLSKDFFIWLWPRHGSGGWFTSLCEQ
jgi:hypothetical protein